MPTIIPRTRIKEDGQVYEVGKPYEVSTETAFYFRKVGWVEEGEQPSTSPVTLEVHDAEHGHEAPEVENG